jgi:hypothetical protein
LISTNAARRPGDSVAFAREGISRARDDVCGRRTVSARFVTSYYKAPRRCY